MKIALILIISITVILYGCGTRIYLSPFKIELPKRDAESLKYKGIKAPPLGEFRIKKGNATFFFKTKEHMENSIVNTKKFEDQNI